MQVRRVVLSGDEAFAHAALHAGVGWVTGYPGSPSAGTLEALASMPEARDVHVTWAVNELIAMESAFGASLAGRRSLLCVKSVGLNIALDPLMTVVLTGCNAGLVILLGDDPGGWASQNEQDSRFLALMADLPLLEPADVQEAYDLLRYAFDLSEAHGLPVIVREMRALSLAKGEVRLGLTSTSRDRGFVRKPMRWISLPENVVRNHRRLHDRLNEVSRALENCPFNRIEGRGRVGLVACGADYFKLQGSIERERLDRFHVMKLSTFNPLPPNYLHDYLASVDAVLVLEESEACVEDRLAAAAHAAGLPTRVLGRMSGHVPVGGELDTQQIVEALSRYAPGPMAGAQTPVHTARSMPSQKPLCADCPYLPVFHALLDEIETIGGRDQAVIVGEPGCMVRAQLPPLNLMDVKYSLGSSVGLAVGLAASSTGRKVVSLTGDSSFLHHGWGGLVEAARNALDLLVIVLDNGTTALTGCQPHAGTPYDVRGRQVHAVDLASLITLLGGRAPLVVDPMRQTETREAIRAGLRSTGLEVIVARGLCPRLDGSQ